MVLADVNAESWRNFGKVEAELGGIVKKKKMLESLVALLSEMREVRRDYYHREEMLVSDRVCGVSGSESVALTGDLHREFV